MADNVYIDEAEEPDWTKEPYVPSTPEALPASSNKEFWEDSKVFISDGDKLSERSRNAVSQLNHSLQQIGDYFVCSSCPFTHTINLSPKNFTLNRAGNLIPIDRTK